MPLPHEDTGDCSLSLRDIVRKTSSTSISMVSNTSNGSRSHSISSSASSSTTESPAASGHVPSPSKSHHSEKKSTFGFLKRLGRRTSSRDQGPHQFAVAVMSSNAAPRYPPGFPQGYSQKRYSQHANLHADNSNSSNRASLPTIASSQSYHYTPRTTMPPNRRMDSAPQHQHVNTSSSSPEFDAGDF